MTETRDIEIEVREDPSRQSPGILTGRLLSYGEQIVHKGTPELFESRSLNWNVEDGIALFDSHAGAQGEAARRPVGVVFPEASDTEVRISSPLPDSVAGRRVAAAVKAGRASGLSIEFSPVTETRSAGVRRIGRANLTGLAVVDTPAYPSAKVEVRGKRKVWLPPIPRS